MPPPALAAATPSASTSATTAPTPPPPPPTKLEAIRSKMPSSAASRAERVEAKYDVVLDYPNLELHSAAASGNVGLVHYALTHGQPVNSLLHGCLPLHAACSGGSVSVVRMLIERGADVNAPRLPRRYSENKRGGAPAVGTAGSTPLHFAAANGHAPIVQILLACGAVPDKQDKNGLTPLDLADLSGYTEVVRTLAVWSRIAEPSSGEVVGESSTRRARGHSLSSTQVPVSEEEFPSRRGKERAGSAVSHASERGIRLLRSSLESGLNAVRPMTSTPSEGSESTAGPGDTNTPTGGLARSNSSTRNHTPPITLPTSLQITSTIDSDNPSSNLPSPFQSHTNSPSSDDEELGHHPAGAVDAADAQNPSPGPRSSRRPSLPSIFERAAHPGVAFRSAMRKSPQDSSPSISESSPPPNAQFFRGRSRTQHDAGGNRTKVNRQAILQLFRRGQSPPSRSPSPPQRSDSNRVLPPPPSEFDHDADISRHTSMDPELAEMVKDITRLGEQLNTAAVLSAPPAKTQFFEGDLENTSRFSVASDPPHREAASGDRSWDRRTVRNGGSSGVISPSPLANEWGLGEDGEDIVLRRTQVRRSLTDIRKPSHNAPRRMISTPAMPMTKPRSSTLPSQHRVFSSDSSVPASASTSPPGNGPLGYGLPEADVVAAVLSTRAPEGQTQGDTTMPHLDTSEESHTEGDDQFHDDQTNVRRFRGESIGSNGTASSRLILTPPGSTAPTFGHTTTLPRTEESERESDMRSLGLIVDGAMSSGARSRAQSASSGPTNYGHPKPLTPVTRSPGAAGNGLSRESSRAPRPASRQISTHAEAQDVLEQTERDILEIAQMPLTQDSSRSLADQLAAYGESHAIAQEFARAERRSTVSSGSERRSYASSTSNQRRSVNGSSSRVSSTILGDPSLPMAAVNNIYDRRNAAYRERLNALAAVPPIYHHHTRGHPTAGARSRSYSSSDNWVTAGPGATTARSLGHPRRLTDPLKTPDSNLSPPPTADSSDVDNHPHISGPMPMPAANQAPPGKKTGRSPATSRAPLPLHKSPSLSGPHAPAPETGLARGGSINRYKGLAQARAFANASSAPRSAAFSSAFADAQDSDESDAQRQAPYAVAPASWSGMDPYPDKKSGKWGQLRGAKDHIKGAFGSLRR